MNSPLPFFVMLVLWVFAFASFTGVWVYMIFSEKAKKEPDYRAAIKLICRGGVFLLILLTLGIFHLSERVNQLENKVHVMEMAKK